ncbi:MAG: hypothetical protein E7089_06685 [Bacteroidales bacterium]|nr:hypothetical protein [Bacteroidales bacterium]
MMKDFQDKIDEYILDKMPSEERVQFEAEIGKDKAKREQLEFTRNVKNAISSREEKLEMMKMMQKKYDREHRRMRRTGTDACYTSAPVYAEKKLSRKILWWISGIAALLVIGLFIVNPFVYNSILMDSNTDKIRGEENDIFDTTPPTTPPVTKDSTANDTIQHDTTKVNNWKNRINNNE